MPETEEINNTAAPGENQPNKAIIVAGMHRSGTSALTRILNILGVRLNRELLDPVPGNNDLGFFESKEIYDIHEKMLASFGSSWDDYFAVPREWFTSDSAHEFKQEILAVLHRDFDDARIWAVKDPRICRLLPLWLSLVRDMGSLPHVVIPLRNPMEVAQSLKKRDDIPLAKALLFWLRHALEAERDSRGIPRSFISYSDLMRDWTGTARKISRDLKIDWPNDLGEAEEQTKEFLQEALWRHRVEPEVFESREDIVWWVKKTYHILTGNPDADYKKTVEELSLVRDRFETAALAFGPEITINRQEIGRLKDEAGGLEVEIGARDSEIQRLTGEIQARDEQIEHLRRDLTELENQRDRAAAELASCRERVSRIYEILPDRASVQLRESGEIPDPMETVACQIDDMQGRMDSLGDNLRDLDQRVASLHQSRSYKIGRAVLAPFRFALKTLPAYLKKKQGEN